jgi:hypothetical protein|tara:strand:- start:244 stop:687 length:444 start_codon:yes stop_codon:yes gene_type:complete
MEPGMFFTIPVALLFFGLSWLCLKQLKQKHLLLTTIAAVVLVGTAFAGPIHDAAKNGDLAGVQAELDKGADVNAKNENGGTPLLYATLSGHREIDERLEEYALVQLDVLRSFLSNMKNWLETVVNRIYPGSRISVKMIDPPGGRPYC